MALLYSPPVDPQLKLPDFELPTVYGDTVNSRDFADTSLLLMFICQHCPYVKAIEDRLIELGRSYEASTEIKILAVCSNDATDYPEDEPAALAARAREKNYTFPYLVDANQQLAKTVGAVCTPDFFLFGPEQMLYYRGRLDDSWRDPSLVRKRELHLAITNLLSGQPLTFDPQPSMGCSIKWLS